MNQHRLQRVIKDPNNSNKYSTHLYSTPSINTPPLTNIQSTTTELISLIPSTFLLTTFLSSTLSPLPSTLSPLSQIVSQQTATDMFATLTATHVAMAAGVAIVCGMKGIESATPILRSLFCGVGELYRVTKLPDTEELEVARVSSLPPLSTPLTTSGLRSDGLSPNGVLVTYSIKAKGGKEHEIRRLLVELQEGAGGMEGVMTTVVNQDEEDRGNFMMLQRFTSSVSMRHFQNSLLFKLFTARCEAALDGPMGLYMVNERNGVMGTPVHPFGPGGEGGREDAIYSSPTNLQGSGT